MNGLGGLAQVDYTVHQDIDLIVSLELIPMKRTRLYDTVGIVENSN